MRSVKLRTLAGVAGEILDDDVAGGVVEGGAVGLVPEAVEVEFVGAGRGVEDELEVAAVVVVLFAVGEEVFGGAVEGLVDVADEVLHHGERGGDVVM